MYDRVNGLEIDGKSGFVNNQLNIRVTEWISRFKIVNLCFIYL